METWKVRERCLRGVAWLPVGLCFLLVGWSYYVFVFSVCRYLFRHEHVFQGMIYLVMVTTITVLLLWSYILASFGSPGYPSEVREKNQGYHRAQNDDRTMDQEDGARVGLLEPDPYNHHHLSASPNNESPFHADERRSITTVTTAATTTVAVNRLASSSPTFVDRSSNDSDDVQPPYLNSFRSQSNALDHDRDHHDHWSQEGAGSSSREHRPSSPSSSLTLAINPASSTLQLASNHYQQQHQHHTVVDMEGDNRLYGNGSHEHRGTGQPRYSGDGDGDADHEGDTPSDPFLGPSTRRFTVKRDGTMRYCQKCKFEKPDRTHHCSSCKRCVLKMDHHCPWLNNCVGHKNYKAFFLFVFWTAVYCVTIVACTIPVTAEVLNLPFGESEFDPQWIFIIVIALIFGLCLVPFAIHHALLIKSNKTTIESFEKHKYRMGNSGEVMQSRVLNVFDLGQKQNIAQVMGPVWYLWLIPVRNSVGDGWTFPANDYGKSMLYTDDDANSIHSHYTSQYHQRTPSSTSSPRPRGRGDRNHHRRRPSSSSALLLTHTQYRQQQQQQQQQQLQHNQQTLQQVQEHSSFDLSGSENEAWNVSGNDHWDGNGNDTDLEHDHYRRDSDESDGDHHRDDHDGHHRRGGRFRRFGTLPAIRNNSDEEAEEYLYDSDEPVTIRFTDHGR